MWFLFYTVVVAGFIVALERTVYLHKGKIRSRDFLSGMVNLLKKGRNLEALSLCEETPGPVAAVIKTGILNLRKNTDEYMLAIQGTASSEIPLLEKRVNTVAFVSRMVQLIGLLGALLAFKGPFELMVAGNVGVLSAQQFASATVEAIGFVAAGLAFSAIFYAIYHLLNGRVRALVAEMERSALEIQGCSATINGVNPIDAQRQTK